MSAPQHPHRPRRPAAGHSPRTAGHSANLRPATATHRPRVSASAGPANPAASAAPAASNAAEPASPSATARGDRQWFGVLVRILASITPPILASALARIGPRLVARRKVPLAALLTMLTVALGAFAIVAADRASALREAAAQNAALTDSMTTGQITSQVSAAVDTIFSYNYTDIGRTRQAARRVLTGAAVRQYASAIRTVARAAVPDKLVVTTAVTYAGVEYLHGDRAHVLMFVNLSDTSGVTGQTTSQPGMLAVDVIWQSGMWKITNLHTFTEDASRLR